MADSQCGVRFNEEKEELVELLTSIRYYCQGERIESVGVGSTTLPHYRVIIRDELWERIRVAIEAEVAK